MAKSLDPASILVAPASGGTVSPFDCSTGVDDNDSGWFGDSGGHDDGQDDTDHASGC